MSAANVRNIQALADLKAALARFKSDALEPLHAAQQEIQRTQEWLGERERHWQREVQRCEQEARQAQAALDRCQGSGYRDKEGRYHEPDCSAQVRAAAQAQYQLRQTRAELENVQRWASAVRQAGAEFQREAKRLTNMLNNDVAKASALLERKIAILQGYIGESAPTAEEIDAAIRAVVATVAESNLSVDYSGAGFEQWAISNVFHDKRRIVVPIELNQHLSDVDEEGLGLLKSRISDNFVDVDGSLWDAKAYDEHTVIDRDQLRDYRLMENAGYVIDGNGNRVPITSVNYLFSNRAAAEKNRIYLKGEATAWFVEWSSDGSGQVRLLEDQ